LFVDAVAERAVFARSRLVQAIFHRARCASARFDGADLEYADFSHADVSGSVFGNNRWLRTKFHSAKRENTALPLDQSILLEDEELAAAERWPTAT
jgi:uncharacterized protein YjbI with pentapeptide repeats